MHRHAVVLGVAFAGLAAFALLMGWAFFQLTEALSGGRSLGPLWPYLVGGVMLLAALLAFLLWLSIYSTRHAGDERDQP